MVKSTQRKKPNITIISDAKTLNELKKWSESAGLSMNALINEVLTKNLSFYRYVSEHDSMIIPSTIYSTIIEILPEKILVDLVTRIISEMVQSIFAHNNTSYTMDNMAKSYFENVGLWSGIYSIFKRYGDADSTNLIFEHKYGIKWSRIIAQSISNLLKETLHLSSDYKILPNTVILKVGKK